MTNFKHNIITTTRSDTHVFFDCSNARKEIYAKDFGKFRSEMCKIGKSLANGVFEIPQENQQAAIDLCVRYHNHNTVEPQMYVAPTQTDEHGYAKLTAGTAKQKKWATDLRVEMMQKLNDRRETWFTTTAQFERAVAALANCDDAVKIIDARNSFVK